jgi:hypothetical protein
MPHEVFIGDVIPLLRVLNHQEVFCMAWTVTVGHVPDLTFGERSTR